MESQGGYTIESIHCIIHKDLPYSRVKIVVEVSGPPNLSEAASQELMGWLGLIGLDEWLREAESIDTGITYEYED